MTNLQLWLGIAIPSLLVILSWMQTNSRLSDLKDSFKETIIVRFNQVDQRLTQLESRMGHLEADYKDFYGMEKKLEGRVDELSRR